MIWKYIDNNEKINLEITKEEAEVLQKYLLRKIMKLEESGLEDTYCYKRLISIYDKIFKKI